MPYHDSPANVRRDKNYCYGYAVEFAQRGLAHAASMPHRLRCTVHDYGSAKGVGRKRSDGNACCQWMAARACDSRFGQRWGLPHGPTGCSPHQTTRTNRSPGSRMTRSPAAHTAMGPTRSPVTHARFNHRRQHPLPQNHNARHWDAEHRQGSVEANVAHCTAIRRRPPTAIAADHSRTHRTHASSDT